MTIDRYNIFLNIKKYHIVSQLKHTRTQILVLGPFIFMAQINLYLPNCFQLYVHFNQEPHLLVLVLFLYTYIQWESFKTNRVPGQGPC